MSDKFVSVGLLSIDSASQGSKPLEDAMDFTWSLSKEKKPVATMNRRRIARGYRKATKVYTWSLTTPIRTPSPEVDWHQLCEDDEEFMLKLKHDADGQVRQFLDCVVNSVEETENEAGEAQWAVSGLCLDVRRVASAV